MSKSRREEARQIREALEEFEEERKRRKKQKEQEEMFRAEKGQESETYFCPGFGQSPFGELVLSDKQTGVD